jgi:hypothetical protein
LQSVRSYASRVGDLGRAEGVSQDASHFVDLSEPCQAAMINAAAVGKACKADVKQLCAGTKPGGGQIEACMKSHMSETSDICKDALSQATAPSCAGLGSGRVHPADAQSDIWRVPTPTGRAPFSEIPGPCRLTPSLD